MGYQIGQRKKLSPLRGLALDVESIFLWVESRGTNLERLNHAFIGVKKGLRREVDLQQQSARRSPPSGNLLVKRARLLRIAPGFEGVAIAGLAAATPFAKLNCDFLGFVFNHRNILWCDRARSSRFHDSNTPSPLPPVAFFSTVMVWRDSET